jgi:hypothetical protein
MVRAERWFPVRVPVAIPPGVFGPELGIMQGWLDAQLRREA